MRRLLAQPHPHLVLLSPFAAKQSKNSDNHKHHHYAQLNVRPQSQASQQARIIIANIKPLRVAKIYTNGMIRIPESVSITLHLYPPVLIVDHHRDSVIAVQNTQYQREISILVRRTEATHRLSPSLHLHPLLALEVMHQKMAHHQRHDTQEHRSRNQYNLDLPNPVSPLHNRYIT